MYPSACSFARRVFRIAAQISSRVKGICIRTMCAESKNRSTCSFSRKIADLPSSVL